jgi:hypothetical protein
MKVEVRRLNLSTKKLVGLGPQERYVFALAGHIFNDLMLLQKLVHTSRQPPDSPSPVLDASVGLSMFMLRLLAAKTHEAVGVLSKESIRDVLMRDYFASDAVLTDEWEKVIAAYKDLPWLPKVRNKLAFHYMSAAQWTPHLDDALCTDGYVWVGKRFGDTLYQWAEMAAALPAMREVNADEPFKGLGQMLDELGGLLKLLTNCLAKGLQTFMIERLMDEPLSDPIQFDAPDLDAFHLTYFFGVPPRP